MGGIPVDGGSVNPRPMAGVKGGAEKRMTGLSVPAPARRIRAIVAVPSTRTDVLSP
jgi:hypothetical protein